MQSGPDSKLRNCEIANRSVARVQNRMPHKWYDTLRSLTVMAVFTYKEYNYNKL